MKIKQTTYDEKFTYNFDATNVATVTDCNNFVQAMLSSDGIYGIEIVEESGKTYTKLYNSGDSLNKVFCHNMNSSLKITAYSLLEKDDVKLKKIISRFFKTNTSEKFYHTTFEVFIVDQKTKLYINSKSKTRKNSKISDELKTAIATETNNFINKYRLSSINLIMYRGSYIYYHNHITKAIDEIQANIEYKLQKDVNEKTLRSYIGEELRKSPNIIQEVILHDIVNNKTKGSTKWIAIKR